MKKEQETFLLGVVFLLTSLVTTVYSVFMFDGQTSVLSVFASLAVALLGLMVLDIHSSQPSNTAPWRKLLVQYLVSKLLAIIGNYVVWKFKQDARNFQEQQFQLLLKILHQNRNTKFYKNHGLQDISSVKEFQKKMPLTDYTHYKTYVKEIELKGLPDVLFPGKADYLAVTSGTTSGENKLFPKTSFTQKRVMMSLLLLKTLFGYKYLKKVQTVRVYPKFTYSSTGVRMGPLSGMTADKSLSFNVTPENCGKIESEPESFYIYHLFALAEEEIGNMVFSTSSSALSYFKFLERNWRQLCTDLEAGKIVESLKISNKLRNLFNSYLKGGNPERAKWLRSEFEKGFKDIVPRIWPTCMFIAAFTTGGFHVQALLVKNLYLGGIPMLSPGHIATESMYGLNFYNKTNMSEYVCLPQLNFFEFIRLENGQCDTILTTYLGHQVEVGTRYELVVTTWDGLYRYRTGDIVEITGFYGTVPKYQYIQRTCDILSVDLEKVPVFLLDEVLLAAAKSFGRTIVNYTTTESFRMERLKGYDEVTGKLYYVVFLEFEDDIPLTRKECEQVDEELMRRHEVYAAFRRKGTISPLRICQVRKDTFEHVRKNHLDANLNTCASQYKLPHITRKDELLLLLDKFKL